MSFSGSDYIAQFDHARLTGQIRRVFDCMKDGQWRSLREISERLGYGEASISAQLRNLRKAEFGAYTVDKKRAGEAENGLFVYRLRVPESNGQMRMAI